MRRESFAFGITTSQHLKVYWCEYFVLQGDLFRFVFVHASGFASKLGFGGYWASHLEKVSESGRIFALTSVTVTKSRFLILYL